MKSVYHYENYRLFLRDAYEHLKREPGGYSYARLSKRLRLGSANYSQLIIEGKRRLTLEGAHFCADTFAMNEDERRYLETLVLLEEVEDRSHVRLYRTRLAELKAGKIPSRRRTCVGPELGHWYTTAILVWLDGKPENLPFDELASRIGIGASEAKEAVGALLRSEVVSIVDGVYRPAAGNLVWNDRHLRNEWQKNYLRAQLERTQEVFKTAYEKGAKFHSYTFTVDEEEAEYYAGKLATLMDRMISEADRQPHRNLMQVNFQVYGLSKTKPS